MDARTGVTDVALSSVPDPEDATDDSRSRPYTVVARYESGSGGKLVPVGGHCSCPVGHNCKHTAAMLLAARYLSPEARDIDDGSAGENASRDVRGWLDD